MAVFSTWKHRPQAHEARIPNSTFKCSNAFPPKDTSSSEAPTSTATRPSSATCTRPPSNDQFRVRQSGKNSADIRMVVDALSCYTKGHVDTFVISAATPISRPGEQAARERQNRHRRRRRNSTSDLFINNCDQFILLRRLGARRTAQGAAASRPAPLCGKTGEGDSKGPPHRRARFGGQNAGSHHRKERDEDDSFETDDRNDQTPQSGPTSAPTHSVRLMPAEAQAWRLKLKADGNPAATPFKPRTDGRAPWRALFLSGPTQRAS